MNRLGKHLKDRLVNMKSALGRLFQAEGTECVKALREGVGLLDSERKPV
jgi:hypothetical protein